MSVVDENRPWCKKCGNVIDTWRKTPCDDGTCMDYLKEKDGWNAVGAICDIQAIGKQFKQEIPQPSVKIVSSSGLHDYASTVLLNAIGDWIKNKNDVKLFDQVEYAKALRIAANHIDGVAKS